MDFFDERHLDQVLSNINSCKYSKEASALFICLYYSGARPAEVLELKGKNVYSKGRYIHIEMTGKKRGLSRLIVLKKNQYSIQLLQYFMSLYPDVLAFKHFIGKGKYQVKYKIKSTGEFITKEYPCESYKLRYHFKKWTEGILEIPPYYLRHNRFSKLAAAGVSLTDIQQMKGGKTLSCVQPYVHMSLHTAKRIASKNN